MFLIKLINSHSRSPQWIYNVKRTSIVVFSSLTFLFISFHSFRSLTKCGFSVGNPKNLNRKATTINLLVYLPDLQKYKIGETAALFIPIHGARGEKEQNKRVLIIGIFFVGFLSPVSITGETWDFQWSRTFIVLIVFRAIVWPWRLRRCRFLPRPHRHLSPSQDFDCELKSRWWPGYRSLQPSRTSVSISVVSPESRFVRRRLPGH